MKEADAFEGGGGERVVVRRIDHQPGPVGVTPKEDDLLNGEGEIDAGILRNVADEA